MDPLVHEIAERRVDSALSVDAVQPGEGWTFDRQRKMAFAARIVTGVPDMLVTLIFELQKGRRQRRGQPLDHLAGNGSGSSIRHGSYIEVFEERDTSGDAADQMA